MHYIYIYIYFFFPDLQTALLIVTLTFIISNFLHYFYWSNTVIKSHCSIDRYNVTNFQRRKFPRMIIIGFMKSGTYALTTSLQMHPNIIGNHAQEVKFFDNYHANGLCWYIDQMRDPRPSQVMMEDSPTYVLYCPVVFPRLINALHYFGLKLNELKFIVIVRHPIVRALSDFVHWKVHHLNSTSTFDEMAIDSSGQPNLEFSSVSTTRYSYYIKQCLEFVPSNQICFVNGDMLRTNPALLMNKLEKCLGLPPNISSSNFVYNKDRKLYCFVIDNKVKCPSTVKKGRPHPKITRRTADILMKFYESYNKELYEITGEDYGWDYNYNEIDIAD